MFEEIEFPKEVIDKGNKIINNKIKSLVHLVATMDGMRSMIKILSKEIFLTIPASNIGRFTEDDKKKIKILFEARLLSEFASDNYLNKVSKELCEIIDEAHPDGIGFDELLNRTNLKRSNDNDTSSKS